MRTQHTEEHPGDQLLIGPVAGFEQALELVEQELACEDRAYRIMDEGQAPIKAALGHAGRVWREEQEAARLRTVERLRQDALAAEAALDDEASRWLGLLAEALEQGDYSGLAIEQGVWVMSTGKPTEYYIVWEESVDVGSLTWATRLARQKAAEGKAAVQVRRREVSRYRDDEGVEHWCVEEDELVQDAFGPREAHG